MLTILLPLLLGCAAVEVRVVDDAATTPAAQQAGAEEGAEQPGQEIPEPEEGGAEEGGAVDPSIENALATVVSYLVLLAEAFAALAIGAGVIRAAGQFGRSVLGRGDDRWKDDLRIRLGRSLAVGLEFGVAADILKTAIAPTWEVIAELAAIVVLRTLLNYFLERELQHIEARQSKAV